MRNQANLLFYAWWRWWKNPINNRWFDREKETITIIYQIVGYSTKELAKLNEGDELTDFVALGVPTVLHEAKHVIGVAGGLVVHHYSQLPWISKPWCWCWCNHWGREAQYVLLADEFKKFCKNVYIATDAWFIRNQRFCY